MSGTEATHPPAAEGARERDPVAAALRARLNASSTANGSNGSKVPAFSPSISAPLPPSTSTSPPPAVAPGTHSLQSQITPDAANTPHGSLPNTPLAISLISAALAGVVGACGVVALVGLVGGGAGGAAALPAGLRWLRPQLAVYLVAMGVFHLMEFWVTAACNPGKLSVDSFLLNNGPAYHVAHAFGVLEFLVEAWIWPQGWMGGWWAAKGCWMVALPILIAAQALRSLAMIHAAQSFSHLVSRKEKLDDHVLVTHGVYAHFRHPSYTGFFYWALATQLLMGNPIAALGFAKVLGDFFHRRIVDEEKHLVRFFGDEYVQYKKRVGTWLPYGLVNVG